MTNPATNVIGGVDTHKHVHHAAIVTATGSSWPQRSFEPTAVDTVSFSPG